jgi:hypothetical protein
MTAAANNFDLSNEPFKRKYVIVELIVAVSTCSPFGLFVEASGMLIHFIWGGKTGNSVLAASRRSTRKSEGLNR